MSEKVPRILLVEDDELLVTVMRTVLADRGDIASVESGESALELLAERSFDIVIVDVVLPGMDGLEFLEKAHERYPALTALVISGQERFDYAVKAIRAGAIDYMTKPVEPAALKKAVDEALTHHRASALRGPTESVLAIGAHPDDIEIGCGGTLLRHRAAGDSVTLLTLTGGEAGGEPSVRAEEARRAAAMLPARLILLWLDDTGISPVNETIAQISEVVAQVKPSTIYVHTQRDLHQDHRNTNRAALVAARAVPRVYAYESPSTTPEFMPSRFVGIDDAVERKLEMIEVFESQLRHRYLDADLLRSTARYWSRFGSSRFAEAFEVVRAGDNFADSLDADPGTDRTKESSADVVV